ncbi:MAG: hypothetical protein J2P33_17775, partial [Actinobacteria bacterium]|nr:hypothetical protein [Actinomycetota bacterium]
MRRRRFLALGAAAGVAAVPGVATTTASAAIRSPRLLADPPAAGASDSLRDLAAKIGLRVGTAVIPFDLDTPAYAAVLA